MARKTKEERWSEVHATALRQFDRIVDAEQDERDQALEDRRFYSIAGAQWEGAIGEQFANRPMLEVNKTMLGVIRIFNEYRNNRIAATFVPKDGEEDETAEICAGLYRADEEDSRAEDAYDNAFEEGVGGGMGAWRLTTEYEDEYDPDDDRQRIRIEPIYEADSCVYFDLDAKRQDKSDARHCFVLTGMTVDAYKAEWGDDPATWPKQVSDSEFDWFTPDLVYVAEYYVIEDVTRTRITFKKVGGDLEKFYEDELDDEALARFRDVGTIPVSSKRVKARKVRKYILSGGGVLEDCGILAGRNIPVVPYYGKRWFVDGVERFQGHVRPVKDPQRLKNMQVSVLAERAAEGDEKVPILTPDQVAGHEYAWSERGVNRPGYLLLNAMIAPDGTAVPQGPVGYTESAQVPQAVAALLEVADADIDAILGNQQGGEQIESNLSGRAVELIQARLDMQSYIYISNFAKAVRRSAEIWLGMIGDVYGDEDGPRKMMDETGTADFVDLGETVLSDEGRPAKRYDLSKARYDVQVEIGPTSGTKRQATVRNLIEMMGVMGSPDDQKILGAMILRNMEGEGLAPLREYFRKQMVAMGVEEPTEADLEEAQSAQPQQPGAQEQYLMAEAQKSAALAQKAQADTGKAIADTRLKEAETAETLASIGRDDRKTAIDAAESIARAVGQRTMPGSMR